ncbi:hypothetical protein EJB05_20809 [Eragrostis curvula]|uniref:adenine phosphoribosyltransferase n=1 Tax=Eragrostis curvula TaxID=38414 RepID=A0A5J9V1J3_9POAL|nr:hypothetical protein EJB05_20809 [Eragrostis curvula]
MGEEASCNSGVSVMEADGNVAKQQQQQAAKENGRAAVAVAEAVAVDPRLQAISDAIRVVPHFPKPGIMFNDITTLLLRPAVFKDAVDIFLERYRGMAIDAVAGNNNHLSLFPSPIPLFSARTARWMPGPAN